jgi:hypothetical protein
MLRTDLKVTLRPWATAITIGSIMRDGTGIGVIVTNLCSHRGVVVGISCGYVVFTVTLKLYSSTDRTRKVVEGTPTIIDIVIVIPLISL